MRRIIISVISDRFNQSSINPLLESANYAHKKTNKNIKNMHEKQRQSHKNHVTQKTLQA